MKLRLEESYMYKGYRIVFDTKNSSDVLVYDNNGLIGRFSNEEDAEEFIDSKTNRNESVVVIPKMEEVDDWSDDNYIHALFYIGDTEYDAFVGKESGVIEKWMVLDSGNWDYCDQPNMNPDFITNFLKRHRYLKDESCTRESVKIKESCTIVGVKKDDSKKYYNIEDGDWHDSEDDATIFDNNEDAREVWIKVTKGGNRTYMGSLGFNAIFAQLVNKKVDNEECSKTLKESLIDSDVEAINQINNVLSSKTSSLDDLRSTLKNIYFYLLKR